MCVRVLDFTNSTQLSQRKANNFSPNWLISIGEERVKDDDDDDVIWIGSPTPFFVLMIAYYVLSFEACLVGLSGGGWRWMEGVCVGG
ncbi:hypothetical protein DM02DRAFT_618446 [Periconia macrospinosa]|uniref:Transmembrane protein n=1 Tax=Periconia macrospinosa TaxID=97972 RepID=A0A2V1DAY8_9PLEO|nr:hypothetical protein DM02DRAFT_618446 [Periconia macrospinosa]